jgi:hypothetical protein
MEKEHVKNHTNHPFEQEYAKHNSEPNNDSTTISSNQHKSEQQDYILHKQRHIAKQATETHTTATEKSLPA